LLLLLLTAELASFEEDEDGDGEAWFARARWTTCRYMAIESSADAAPATNEAAVADFELMVSWSARPTKIDGLAWRFLLGYEPIFWRENPRHHQPYRIRQAIFLPSSMQVSKFVRAKAS